jgi:predicted phage terminase large subunit-like protein
MVPGCFIIVENAASGFGIIETLKLSRSLVFPFNPGAYGGKEKRAEMVTGYWEGGNVFLPEISYMHSEYLPEITAFPKGSYRDRVDAMSMALIWLTRGAHAEGAGAQQQHIPGLF